MYFTWRTIMEGSIRSDASIEELDCKGRASRTNGRDVRRSRREFRRTAWTRETWTLLLLRWV
jgi:hypothetical protein